MKASSTAGPQPPAPNSSMTHSVGRRPQVSGGSHLTYSLAVSPPHTCLLKGAWVGKRVLGSDGEE